MDNDALPSLTFTLSKYNLVGSYTDKLVENKPANDKNME